MDLLEIDVKCCEILAIIGGVNRNEDHFESQDKRIYFIIDIKKKKKKTEKKLSAKANI